jgi:formylglycine-generating enzyme required for sulfatase activity
MSQEVERLKKLLLEGLLTSEEYEVLVGRLQVGGSVITGQVEAGGDVTGRDKIVNNHYHGPPTEDPQKALEIYCRLVAGLCEHLPLRGVAKEATDAENSDKAIGLAQVYVALDTTTAVKLSEEEKKDRRGNEDTRPLTALEALQQQPKLVLLGDPGGGKSTFVSHLAYCLAAQVLDPAGRWHGRLGWPASSKATLPLLLTLRDFAQFRPAGELDPTSPERLGQFITHRLHNMGLGFAQKVIQEKLDKGEMVVLLDGLDEVTTTEQRLMVKQAIEGFIKRYNGNQFVVTCRILSYQAPSKKERELRLTELPTFTLARFSEKKIDQFIEAWYGQLAAVRGLKEPEQKAELLKTAVRQADLRRVAENPLLLTVMALVHGYDGDLPSARALLYDRCVEMLLWRWDQVRSEKVPALKAWLSQVGLVEQDLIQLLCEVAYQTHTQGTEGEKVTGISEFTLRTAVEGLGVEPTPAVQLLQLMKLRAGLLVEQEVGVFSFPHRTFQEYLAGVYLSNQPDFAERADQLASEKWGLWREVIKLAVGRLVYNIGQNDAPLALVERLLDDEPEEGQPPLDPTTYWRKVWLAGELLLEMGVERVSRHKMGKKRLPEVREKLTELVTTSQLTLAERAKAGVVLAEVGDEREEVMKVAGMEFCFVPAGEFWMGENEKEHPVNIPYPYAIGRLPVSNAQFAEFVQAGGYSNPTYWPEATEARFWTPAGFKGGIWDDKPRQRQVNFGKPFNLPNHPAVGISWYEALAFSRWLTEQWASQLPAGWVVRLPSEAEWEKMARGGVQIPVQPIWGPVEQLKHWLNQPLQSQKNELVWRPYPWGKEWKPEYNNSGESEIGSTMVSGGLGQVPSPYGCQEVVGQVWEWTQTIYGKWNSEKGEIEPILYPYVANDGREELARPKHNNWIRVLRGGGWSNDRDVNKCSYRDWNLPHSRGLNLGFRVLFSPPSFSVL